MGNILSMADHENTSSTSTGEAQIDLQSTQNLVSRLCTSSPNVLTGALKISSIVRGQTTTDSLIQEIQKLAVENSRLRQKLVTVGYPVPFDSNIAVDNSPKFTDFPRLPVKIRYMIWKLVAHHPRIVEVRLVD